MTVNLSEYAEEDLDTQGLQVQPWWTGWDPSATYLLVLPVGDIFSHVDPICPCNPDLSICNGIPIMTHNSFDERV